MNGPSEHGVILIAILCRSCNPLIPFLSLIFRVVDGFLFGVVSQQFYGYWVTGFKDTLRLRIFVVVQYFFIALQCILMWSFAYDLFVILNLGRSKRSLWQGPVNSLCQVVIILSANIFLAARIQYLSKSRFQSGIVITLSVLSFVLGAVSIMIGWLHTQILSSDSIQNIISSVRHGTQALVEILITIFLTRVLLKSLSGIRNSDSILYYLIRTVIQTGCLASGWAIAELATRFSLQNTLTYRLFDITSGAVYTHVIFDTILSRVQLREHMAVQTQFELGLSGQARRSQISRQRRFTTLFFRSSVSGAETSGTTPTRSDLLESKPVGSTAISEVNAIELQNLRAKKSDEQCEPHPRQECED
ncbi:hypothetical protein BGW80DRAFT_1302166 [Lactifluus volemus]|nr:hypothetical protein BGW80DRAFT_1302166 [Lactifluus volemus]